jgi:hypothetical protein
MKRFGLPGTFGIASILGGKKPTPQALARLTAQIADLDATRADLVAQRDEMVDILKDSISFEQILPGKKHTLLHEQLLDNEQVHKLSTIEELVEKRIGDEGSNKRCFARVNRDGKKPIVTTGIFTALIDISSEETTSYADIPGNINGVKEMPIEPFHVTSETKTVAAILYTISNDGKDSWDKGGRPLAEEVYAFLKAEAEEHGYQLVISTLSPVRKFSPWLSQQNGYEGFWDNEEEIASNEFMAHLQDEENHIHIKQMLLRYLLTERDPVLNFHLGNGAYIGDIKINPDNPKDWVMINYVYPDNEEHLAANKEFYNNSKMRMLAPHLLALIGHDPELQAQAAYFSGGHTAMDPSQDFLPD